MGNYIATVEVLKKYHPERQLIQRASDGAVPVAGLADAGVLANIETAIANAESEIDGRLSPRMSVPVSPVPSRLELCAATLTLYFLVSRKVDSPHWEKLYTRELTWLDQVTQKELGIGAEQVSEVGGIQTTASRSSEDRRVFAGGGINDFGTG